MKTIEKYIETEMNGKIANKKNSPLPGLLVLAVGIGLLALLRFAKMGDALMTTCLTLGIIAIIVGLIFTAMSSSGALSHYVYQPTRSRMREKKVYLSLEDYKTITEAIGRGDLRLLFSVKPVVSSNSAVYILASRDGACALLQAGRYDTGGFEPETDVCMLAGPETENIASLLNN